MMITKIIEIVSTVLKINPCELSIESQQTDFEQWDSLTQLIIINKIEDEFNLRIDDLIIKKLNSIKAIHNYLKDNYMGHTT